MEMCLRVFEQISAWVAISGWICAIFTRTLPVWIVTGVVDNSTDTLSLYWDGIWLNWQDRSIEDMHCHFYQSLLPLAGRFNSWKISINVLLGVGVIPIMIYIVSVTFLSRNVRIKAAAGSFFILSGLLMLVIMSWITHFTNSDLDTAITLKRDWGAAVYFGWIGSVFFLIGGGMLCAWWWFKPAPLPQGQIMTPSAPLQEMADPLFAMHHDAFVPSIYGQTTRPL